VVGGSVVDVVGAAVLGGTVVGATVLVVTEVVVDVPEPAVWMSLLQDAMAIANAPRTSGATTTRRANELREAEGGRVT
jgi:hypothetical protein